MALPGYVSTTNVSDNMFLITFIRGAEGRKP